MKLLYPLLPLLFSFVLKADDTFKLKQDLLADADKLQHSKGYFISDNSSETASILNIIQDLKLFGLVATLDLGSATLSQRQIGQHNISKWTFKTGELESITQLESSIALDTIITQHYLEDRPPSQHRIKNNFLFRTYQVALKGQPNKLFYLTETDQGLLTYSVGDKTVSLSYKSAKQGLNDLLPEFKTKVRDILGKL
jgi:hypothetical protein